MYSISRRPRMLVKFSSAPERSTLIFPPARFDVRIEPLFKSNAADSKDTIRPQWYVVRALADDDEVNVWDLCHHLVQGSVDGLAVPEFAEPDIEQQWVFGSDSHHLQRLANSCEVVKAPDCRLPVGDGFYWFRDSSHSQLEQARDEVGQPPASNRVCIAHFDTGYYPKTCAIPRFLRTDHQKNFVGDKPTDDATDTTSGPFTDFGHGTGTLGILAGDKVEGVPLGGAAFLDVVPIRVANSVVLFWNSAIAKAFEYVRGLTAGGEFPVQVITMSMGGLASQAWADCVNELYELGVFIVTAAGNNFGHLPINNIVYPARFNRVVAACGIMANNSPYADLPLDIMAGNYGPDSKMSTAMAAFTPNAPWARIGCPCTVDHNGAGTSSATPQIAAAAALWIQKYREQWSKYSAGWMRVEAVRKALFDSASLPAGGMKRLGRGIIRAETALHHAPAKEADLQKQPEDEPGFPLFRLINGAGAPRTGAEKRMLELETLQLTQQSRELEQLIPDQMSDPRNISPVVRRRFIEALASTPGASDTLGDTIKHVLLGKK